MAPKVFEETGVELPADNLHSFACSDAIFADPKDPERLSILFHYAIAHLAVALPERPPTRPGDDASDCRWVTPAELDTYLEVTGAEATVDPLVEDCVSEHVRGIIRKATAFLDSNRGWASAQ